MRQANHYKQDQAKGQVTVQQDAKQKGNCSRDCSSARAARRRSSPRNRAPSIARGRQGRAPSDQVCRRGSRRSKRSLFHSASKDCATCRSTRVEEQVFNCDTGVWTQHLPHSRKARLLPHSRIARTLVHGANSRSARHHALESICTHGH